MNCFHLKTWAILAVLCALAGSAFAGVIYMDEDFEGTPFVDRNFPVKDHTTAPTASPLQGINLRAEDADHASPKVEIGTQMGTVVTERAFNGSRSYRLNSGQRLAVTPGRFPFRSGEFGDAFRFWQFAVSVSPATAALPAGTRVGHFKIDYSTTNTALTPALSVVLNLVVNPAGGVDLVCAQNGENLGNVTGASDSWLLTSIIAQKVAGMRPWVAYDPIKGIFKGPQPAVTNALSDTSKAENFTGISQGFSIFTNSNQRKVWLSPEGTRWGSQVNGIGTNGTAEIGWEFAAENGGVVYLDDLYWDAGFHSDNINGNGTSQAERDQASRMLAFDNSVTAPPVGVLPPQIQKIYVLAHNHLDIGFTQPPEQVAAQYKSLIDSQINFAATHADYKFCIEETWTLDQWMKRSTPTEITRLNGLVASGQIGVSGGHSTLHSGNVGVEEMTRFLWNAKKWRDAYGYNIQTVFHDDNPGVNWAYPQTLAKSGIQNLICGLNMFIGGAFTQPYDNFLFNWQGPDGSKVLTWTTMNSYAEGDNRYGIPFWYGRPIDQNKLAAALNVLVQQGYPYDAIIVQNSFDNAGTTVQYNYIRSWNAAHTYPQIIMATPEEFFDYIRGKYGDEIPTISGNWTANWDTGGPLEPLATQIAKTGHDIVPATEKMWSIASSLGLGSYPYADLNNAWEMFLTNDEHSGSGGTMVEWTQQQVDNNCIQFWNYAKSAQASVNATSNSAHATLLGAMPTAGDDSIVVFNSLSWERTDIAQVSLSSALMAENFSLLDTATGANVKYQKMPQTSSIAFIASAVPGVGFKRYTIDHMPPPAASSPFSSGANTIESSKFRVTLTTTGTVKSIYDKVNSRELVDASDRYGFNAVVRAGHLQQFVGGNDAIAPPTSTNIATAASGPVLASLTATNTATSHPLASSQICIYDGLGRVDIVNTMDRRRTDYVGLTTGALTYSLTFPFQLTNYTARLDTAAGWLNPGTQSILGAYRGAHGIQHSIDLSEANYGVTLASMDVYRHSFGDTQTPYGIFPPVEPTILSCFYSRGDETTLAGGATGRVTIEPGSSPVWSLRYSVFPHGQGFDAAQSARFGWEVSTPLTTKFLPASAGAIPYDNASFFSIDAPNVVITDVKKAETGTGVIVKMQEVANTTADTFLRSGYFSFQKVWECSPLEADGTQILDNPSGAKSLALSFSPSEIKSLRVEMAAAPGATPTPRPTRTPTATPTPLATPRITQQPVDRTVNVGQPVSFSVVATGSTPLSYQWKANGTIAVPASFGGNSSVMSLPSTPVTYGGITLNGLRLSCTVTNSVGSAVSYGALLTVLNPTPTPTPTLTPTATPTRTPTPVPAPQITQQPADRTVAVGQPVSFTVVATGPGPLTYQWKVNGSIAVPASMGGNTPTIATASTPATYSGITLNGVRLSCTVTNSGGSVVTRGALLTVSPAGAPPQAR